jgi:hypothetical protein
MPVPLFAIGRSEVIRFEISGASGGIRFYPTASNGYWSSWASAERFTSAASGDEFRSRVSGGY